MVIPLRRRRSSRALAAVVWLLAAGEAWGDGLGATIEVDYSNSQQTLTDATGRTATLYSSVVPQRYLLSLDKQLWPFLTANAFAQYEWTPGSSVVNGVESEISNHRWNVFASLIAGPPVLNFTPYYSRRQEYAVFNSAGVGGTSPTLVNQSFGVYAGWNPAGLPLVSLQVGRREVSDLHGEIQDTRTDDILFSLTYVEVQNLLLRYTLRWSQFWDQRSGVETNDLFQGAQVTWSASALEGRFQSALSYTVGYRNTERLSSGSGTVSVQQFPIAGLSLVETFPSLPALNTLLPNPALIDGNTVTSAGIDIGYGPALAGDQNYRDLGVQFANTTTPANVLWLWVDRQLPPGVAASYTFTAWQSDDNLNWTQLPLAGAVAFGVFDNRFEIPIVRTQARFLKVLTKPLVPGVTTDPKYADVFVTELQAYLVVPASQVPARSWDANGNFNGSARLLLWRDWNLTYWFSVAASHQKDFVPNDWSVTNAFSVSKQVAQSVAVSARVDRTDSEVANRPHEATNRWSAQVSYDPIPVLGAAFSYSGALNDYALGTYLSNGFTLSGHADPWRGVSLNATAGYTWARDELGRTLSGANANVGITLVPIPVLTINGNWGVNTSLSGGTAIALRGDQTTILQGNLAFTPIPALIFTAGLTRSTGTRQGPQTLVNFGAGFSPFAGGQLQIRFSYDETLDTQAQIRSRRFGPGLRWNIRPGAYFDASYTWFDSVQPILITQNRSFFASLFVSIR